MVLSMIKNGSAAAERDQNGGNWLHNIKDNEVLASQLIAAGCDVNFRDNGGYTPLMLAVYWGYAKLTRILLEAGASYDADLYPGSSKRLLHLAVENKHTNIVGLLVKTGANVNARDDKLSTPLHLASAIERDHRKHAKIYINEFQESFYNYSNVFVCS